MKKIVLGLFSLALLTTACKKDKDAPAINKENVAGTYKLMTVKASVNGSSEVDADDREVCEKDNLYKLNADNSFIYQDAGTVCDPAGDFEATWNLNDKEISSEEYPGLNGTITSFDGTNLDVTFSVIDGGNTYKIRSTFQRQ
jgi:hypothetical protein